MPEQNPRVRLTNRLCGHTRANLVAVAEQLQQIAEDYCHENCGSMFKLQEFIDGTLRSAGTAFADALPFVMSLDEEEIPTGTFDQNAIWRILRNEAFHGQWQARQIIREPASPTRVRSAQRKLFGGYRMSSEDAQDVALLGGGLLAWIFRRFL